MQAAKKEKNKNMPRIDVLQNKNLHKTKIETALKVNPLVLTSVVGTKEMKMDKSETFLR